MALVLAPVLIPVLKALLGHWRRRPGQALMLLLGLASATALFSGVQALNLQARESYARAAAQLGADRQATLAPAGGGAAPEAVFGALRRAGWPVSPVVVGAISVGEQRLTVIGVDIVTMPASARPLDLAGDQAGDDGAETTDFAAFIAPPYVALVSVETATSIDGLAQSITAPGATGPPAIAASAQIAPYTVIMDIGAAQALLGLSGQISRFIVGDVDRDRLAPLDVALADVDAPPLMWREPDPAGDAARLTGSFHLNLTAFGLLSFLVGLLIVYAAVGLAFEQRLSTFRTLRACGVSARMLTMALLIELVTLAAVAGAFGVLFGYVIAAAILPDVALSLRSLYGANVAGALTVEPVWWAMGVAVSVAGALAAAARSLVKAYRLPVLAPAQPHAWRAAERRSLRLSLAAAGALLGAAALLLAFGGGLVAGFALLGAVLIAAALALPAALAFALSRAEAAARGAVAQWFWADARLQLPSLSFSLQALLIALAANIGVGAMVGSFRDTFTGWLDQRLAAELYVRAEDAPTAARIAGFLETEPGVTAALPFGFAVSRTGEAVISVVGFTDHATYRDHWPTLARAEGGWGDVARGEAVLINEQLHRASGLGVGDAVALETQTGEWRTRVAGIYSDYGNPRGQAMVAAEVVAARWPATTFDSMLVRVDPAAVEAVAARLADAFALGADDIVRQADVKALSLEIFERTFAVTAAINFLTLAIAGLALLSGLLTLASVRLPQIAPVWALGLTRRRLALLDFGRTAALALATALLAIPLGVVVAWVLTAVINVEAFGWRLPVRAYPGQWASMALLAVGVAAAASVPIVIRLRRLSPADLLRTFASER